MKQQEEGEEEDSYNSMYSYFWHAYHSLRAAAIRCREKKKKWIENLSIKYDELGSINQKLQSEVSSLRSEVAVLKSMLLQHKDCPVTLAMQGGVCVCWGL